MEMRKCPQENNQCVNPASRDQKMINGAQVPLLCPTHAHATHVKKTQALPPSPSSLAAKNTMGVAEARQGAADRSDRGRRCDPACGCRADQHCLSGDPQADRAV